jgi:hypothetical protein
MTDSATDLTASLGALSEQAAQVNTDAAQAAAEPKEPNVLRDPYGRFAANAEKSDDDVLNRLLGTTEPEKSGEEVKKPVEVKAQGTESDKGAEEEAEKPKVSKRATEKARKALELDGWGDDDFEGISEERIVSLGKKAAERQARISQELEAKAKQAKSKTGEAGEEEGSSARVANAEPDSQDDDLISTLKPIKDLLGEEAYSALAAALKKVQASGHEKVTRIEQRLNSVAEREAMDAATQAREQVGKQYPDLQDDEVWDEIVEDMSQLAQIPGRFKDMPSLIEAACRLRNLEPAKQASPTKAKSPAIQAAKQNGVAQARSIQAPAKALSNEDREDLALKALFEGKGRNAARAAWDGI